jgi:uncharacterized protein YbcC (UPF0753/DUF2309 family)
MPFEKAVNQARKLLNANVFQNHGIQAWEKGEIDENILLNLENQLLESPRYYLQQMASHKKKRC